MLSNEFLITLLQKVPPDQAKSEFYFFFFAGSGALGIGGAQVPKLAKILQKIRDLGGSDKTLGGEDLAINPIATIGYPEPLKVADIQSIIDKMPRTETIKLNGDNKSYMASLGYLEREGFFRSMPNSNPLALYAIFDCWSKGGGDLGKRLLLILFCFVLLIDTTENFFAACKPHLS